MRYITPIVEQLHRAALELNADLSINSRLALILIDNAVELIVHRRCTDEIRWRRPFQSEGNALSPAQIRAAEGKFLEGKLNILEFFGDLSVEEKRFISICHDYRNELYHVGLRHDGIIRAMAGQYFRYAVSLFERLRPSYVSVGSDDQISDIARRYIGKDYMMSALEAIPNAAKKLSRRLPPLPDLAKTLSAEADLAISQIEEAFDFLVRNNFSGASADEILRIVQFDAELTAVLEKEQIGRAYDPKTAQRAAKLVASLKASWRPRYRKIPLVGWRRRAADVVRLRSPYAALDRYQALRNDMEYLEEAIGRAADGLDSAIQFEVDRARGK